MFGISLFASGGIGDLALRKVGVKVLVANELLPNRASVFIRNFPETKMFTGDIWKLTDKIIDETNTLLQGNELDFILATPPCQGMSKNGQGKLLQGIREGGKPKIDVRNRLIIPTIKIIKMLSPKIVVFENVPEMKNTIIDDENGNYINIIDYIQRELGAEYGGKAEVIDFADYGAPQRRKRLITIFTKDKSLLSFFNEYDSFLPPYTHSEKLTGNLKKWLTVKDTIGNFPSLDSMDKISSTSNIPFHNVSVLDNKKYFWISNTPPEKGAFDNQCINPNCKFQDNPIHGAKRNGQGINQSKKDTPLYCVKCGELLPRPYTVEKNGDKRLMSGFTSAYKRMSWDKPSSTLTTNLSYACSDHKIHPEQNRVLSLYEAFHLHTISDYEYFWEDKKGVPIKDTLVKDIIGESIPPRGLQIIFQFISDLLKSKKSQISLKNIKPKSARQLSLLDCTC